MAALRNLYANSQSTGFTVNFFLALAGTAPEAFLASPFFTTTEPIRILTEKGCTVSLLIRLCSATAPNAVREVLANPNVKIRYFTAQSFHAKFYVVGDKALVGSANLTDAGLKSNREVSISLQQGRDEAFDELPGLFDLLWDYADVLSEPILIEFEKAFRAANRPQGEDQFDTFLKSYIRECAPPTIRAGSHKVPRQRAFLQTFRRKYDEVLVPAYRALEKEYKSLGRRRKEFSGVDFDIELNRFLGWLRVTHAQGDTWSQVPARKDADLLSNIRHFANDWLATNDINGSDQYRSDSDIEHAERLRSNFSSIEQINSLSYDDIFQTLLGCHAFHELLRFTKGSIAGLKDDFARRNDLNRIKNTLGYLTHGPGDPIQRAYDCIYDDTYRLERFAEACIMELIGWIDPNRPPFNGRTIKGLRFLGFDVQDNSGADDSSRRLALG